eukprot:353367-Chlamydomonas_euryale.AAC.1
MVLQGHCHKAGASLRDLALPHTVPGQPALKIYISQRVGVEGSGPAKGLVGLGGVVGRPRSTWLDRALTALRPVLTSRLAGVGLYRAAHDRSQWRSLCDSAQPAA